MEELFQQLAEFKDANMVRAAFGEPYQVSDRTLIPVARVSYSYDISTSSVAKPAGKNDHDSKPEEVNARPDGGRCASTVRPVAVISIGTDGVKIHNLVDRGLLIRNVTGLVAVSLVLLSILLGRRWRTSSS